MCKKVYILGILFFLILPFTSTPTISADSFINSSAYHFYQGDYNSSKRVHWTAYSVSANMTVGAGIKMWDEPTEVDTGFKVQK